MAEISISEQSVGVLRMRHHLNVLLEHHPITGQAAVVNIGLNGNEDGQHVPSDIPADCAIVSFILLPKSHRVKINSSHTNGMFLL